MSSTPTTVSDTRSRGYGTSERRLPAYHLIFTGIAAAVLAVLLLLLLGALGEIGVLPTAEVGPTVTGVVVLGYLVHLLIAYLYSRIREGRRWAMDRVISLLVIGAFALGVIPLVSLLWVVTVRGIGRVWGSLLVATVVGVILVAVIVGWIVLLRYLNRALQPALGRSLERRNAPEWAPGVLRLGILAGVTVAVAALILGVGPMVGRGIRAAMAQIIGLQNVEFWFTTMSGVIGGMNTGGVSHAIVGTLLITLGATVISVPVGFFTSIFLVEYAQVGWRRTLGRGVTFLIDVMTGIPSIVAGLFGLALFITLTNDPGIRIGAMGSVALSLLMIPTVVRSSEEMLRLVPMELREASYALGVPKWLTIVRVVLRTAVAGLTTSVTLAVARVIGETAPLLLTVGAFTQMNTNMFEGRMQTLPTYINSQYMAGSAVCNSETVTNPVTGIEYPCSETVNLDRAWAAALTLILIVMLLNVFARVVSYYFSPKLQA